MKNIIGKKAEIIAEKFLKKQKYKILETNYRNRIGEIDIICKKNETLVFVEVKYKSSLAFGHPREMVDERKQNKIRKVCQIYLLKNGGIEQDIRFDVVEVLDNEITHIENAF